MTHRALASFVLLLSFAVASVANAELYKADMGPFEVGGVETLTLTVDGKLYAIDSSGRATVPMNNAGTIEVVATATDAAGNTLDVPEDRMTLTGQPVWCYA